MKGREIIISPCSQCGKCCYNRIIMITPEEAKAISDLTNKQIEEFAISKGRVFVLKTVREHCIFLKDKRCVIHEVKPFQCKTYPIIYNYMAVAASKVYRGAIRTLDENYLVFSCESENGHVKAISFRTFIRQTEERLQYLKSVYS